MDGSFFGDGGWFTTIIPVDCASDQHDHLPGDSNYACQRALERLIAGVRRNYPQLVIFMCRPPMDLGVWSLRNVVACFTLLESGTPPSHVAAGDEIRKWSRVRVQHHFFPLYPDQPLLFPSRANRNAPPNWSSEKLDYILLSALSSSPNQLWLPAHENRHSRLGPGRAPPLARLGPPTHQPPDGPQGPARLISTGQNFLKVPVIMMGIWV